MLQRKPSPGMWGGVCWHKVRDRGLCLREPLNLLLGRAQTVKNLPAMQETWVQSLGWEDPLEESMATYSSIPAWRIPWTEQPGGLQSMGLQSQTRLSD